MTRRLLFGIPAVVLAVSYLWLAIDHRTPFLWSVTVHESGRYTLGQTIFYLSHFLREVPVLIAYVLFLLAVSGASSSRHVTGMRAALLVTAIGVLSGAALVVTIRTHGLNSALLDLLQYRTRDDLAGYGTHWRYHWLSTLWFGAAVATAPVLFQRLAHRTLLLPHRAWARAAWAYFLVLTIVFGMSSDTFVDVRYAGHQAREIMTHGPVTLLLGLGLLIQGTRHAPVSRTAGAAASRIHPALGDVVVGIPAYLALTTLTGDVMSEGQSEHGLGAMVGAHYFEHALDYLLVVLLVSGGLLLNRPRPNGKKHVENLTTA
jgi:hypothetical protein